MPESHCQQKLTKAAESALRAGNFPSVYDDCANGVHASYIYPPGRGSNGTLTGRTFMEITQTRYALHADQYNRIAGRQNWNDYAQGRGSLAMGRGANEGVCPTRFIRETRKLFGYGNFLRVSRDDCSSARSSCVIESNRCCLSHSLRLWWHYISTWRPKTKAAAGIRRSCTAAMHQVG
jgi:hypothetical protein